MSSRVFPMKYIVTIFYGICINNNTYTNYKRSQLHTNYHNSLTTCLICTQLQVLRSAVVCLLL